MGFTTAARPGGSLCQCRRFFRVKRSGKGQVEVFDLTGHPKAKRAFGWSHPENANGTGERFVADPEIPPVYSAQTAVKMAIYSDLKQARIK
jgi:hypothetical protein